MCGITVSFGEKLNFNDHLCRANLLVHRGPDKSRNLKINENLILGHNRLKIIDLTNNSNQPFKFDHIHIVFNGMVYNFLDLKKDLSKIYKFNTTSDTEVLAVSYLQWGIKCFEKLEGMFSVVIWDDKKKKLIVARDRLGIKPLYYTRDEKNNLLISSEIKPLWLNKKKKKINNKTIFLYLKYSLYENSENTFFDEINQFENGCLYEITLKSFKKIKYWNLLQRVKENKIGIVCNSNEAYEIYNHELKRIFNQYTLSDTQIALLYSSGLDSNVLYQNLSQNIKTISWGWKNCKYEDELKLVKKFTNNKNAIYKKFSLDEFLESINQIQLSQEMPWGGPNVFFAMKLMQMLSPNEKVVISADGADEVFGGYNKYLNNFNFQKNILNYFNLHIDKTKTDRATIMQKNFIRKYQDTNISIKLPSNSSYHNARYLDILYGKLPRNFRFSDRYSMHSSKELRYPFLDHHLIEKSFLINKNISISLKQNKLLLRKFCRYNIKKKKHINSPQNYWLLNKKFKKIIYTLVLNNDSEILSQILDKNKIIHVLDNFFLGKEKNSFKVWQIFNLLLWEKNFFYA